MRGFCYIADDMLLHLCQASIFIYLFILPVYIFKLSHCCHLLTFCLPFFSVFQLNDPFFSFQNFYKTELNKEEMYIRYIHKLYDLHLKAQNYTGTVCGDRVFFVCFLIRIHIFAVLTILVLVLLEPFHF